MNLLVKYSEKLLWLFELNGLFLQHAVLHVHLRSQSLNFLALLLDLGRHLFILLWLGLLFFHSLLLAIVTNEDAHALWGLMGVDWRAWILCWRVDQLVVIWHISFCDVAWRNIWVSMHKSQFRRHFLCLLLLALSLLASLFLHGTGMCIFWQIGSYWLLWRRLRCV